MNNPTRESDRFPTKIVGSVIRRSISDNDTSFAREPAGAHAEVYDALDYRLMATFPASDATAQY